MSVSARLSLPFILPQQAQKHVTVNEAVRRLDALVQMTVLSRTVTAEPATPTDGAQYILPTGKTGSAWGAMAAGSIAAFQDGAWTAIAPLEGFMSWVADTNTIVCFDGAAWVTLNSALGAGGGGSAGPTYETGTFTPAITASNVNPTITYAGREGVYTRIGRYVWCEIFMATSGVSGGDGVLRISVPFVSQSGGSTHAGSSVFYSANWAANSAPVICLSVPGSSYCQLYAYAGSDPRNGYGAPLTVSALAPGTYNNSFWTNVLYKL